MNEVIKESKRKLRENESKKVKYVLIVVAILLFHISMNFLILNKSEICRVYDEAGKIANSVRYYKFIFLSPHKFKNINDNILTLDRGQAHPPVYELMGAMACKLLMIVKGEFNEKSIILTTNAFFLFILLMSTYCIGATLYDSKIGVLAAFLVSFFPMLFGHSRMMLLDFPLACMVSLSFCLLFKTDKFKSLRYSILFGVTLGLSQLTKEAFISFMFFALIYYFFNSYFTHQEQKRRIMSNFLFSLVSAIIVAGPVYLRPVNLSHCFKTYIDKATLLSPMPVFYYFQNFIAFTGTYMAIAVSPLVISYLMNLKLRNKIIFLWISAPLIIFSLAVFKSYRFLLPILPALALIVAQEIFNNKSFFRIKKIYISFLILVAVMQYAIYSLDIRVKDPYFFRKYYASGFPGILTYQKDKYYPVVCKLLEIFQHERNVSNRKSSILFLFNIGKIHCPLEYKFELERVPFVVVCPQVADEVDAPEPGTVNWNDYVLKAGYIVDKTGYTGRGGSKENVEGQLREGFRKYRANFKKIAEIKIFDDSQIYVYKNLKLP